VELPIQAQPIAVQNVAANCNKVFDRMKSFQKALLDLDGVNIHRYHKDDLLDDQILQIFGGRCIRCGKQTIVVHEIVPKSHGKEYLAAENRVTLCNSCHEWAHSNTAISISILTERRIKVLQNLGIKDEE